MSLFTHADAPLAAAVHRTRQHTPRTAGTRARSSSNVRCVHTLCSRNTRSYHICYPDRRPCMLGDVTYYILETPSSSPITTYMYDVHVHSTSGAVHHGCGGVLHAALPAATLEHLGLPPLRLAPPLLVRVRVRVGSGLGVGLKVGVGVRVRVRGSKTSRPILRRVV